MPVVLRSLAAADVDPYLTSIARLRKEVFASFPYLFGGSIESEEGFLREFVQGENAIIVVALDSDQVVGASIGSPLAQHKESFGEAFLSAGFDLDDVFYCAESVLLPLYRGQGLGHAFFDQREAHARRVGLRQSTFCSVIRPESHPLKPPGFKGLDKFWEKRGYRMLPGVIASFSWPEPGSDGDVEHPMQFWLKELAF